MRIVKVMVWMAVLAGCQNMEEQRLSAPVSVKVPTPPVLAATMPPNKEHVRETHLRLPFDKAIEAALRGDTRMQNRLAMFFIFCGDEWSRSAEYWFRQSMALGNMEAQYSLSGWLEQSDEPARKQEGRRLLEDLANRGHEAAIRLIKLEKEMGWEHIEE